MAKVIWLSFFVVKIQDFEEEMNFSSKRKRDGSFDVVLTCFYVKSD